MKRLPLQWRITLMTVLLIGVTCVAMNLLICSSGIHYMDAIGNSLQGYTTGGAPAFLTRIRQRGTMRSSSLSMGRRKRSV